MNRKFITSVFVLFMILGFSANALEEESFLNDIFDGSGFFSGVITGFGIFDTGELFMNVQPQKTTKSMSSSGNSQEAPNEEEIFSGNNDEGSCIPTSGKEDCWSIGDEDCNGFSDCNDSLCFSVIVCNNIPDSLIETDCNDDFDNDQDGAKDCNDSDCSQDVACNLPGTTEGFNQGYNADNDLYVNNNPLKEQYCSNKKDDDTDGYIDCADTDCKNDLYCNKKEICDNKLDDDSDGSIDCSDADCSSGLNCVGQEDCDDKLDNDKDGMIDCADPNCTFACTISVEICTDGIDNDKDGMIDCADPNCAGSKYCAQSLSKNQLNRKLTPEKIVNVNELFRGINGEILSLTYTVDRLEKLTKEDAVVLNYLKTEVSYPLGVLAGSTSRASTEASQGHLDTLTIEKLVERFKLKLTIIKNNIIDAYDMEAQNKLRQRYNN